MVNGIQKIKENRGAAAIFSVVTIGIFAMIMATNITFLSIDDLDMANAYKSKDEIQIVLNSCVDDVLRRVQMNRSYSEFSRTIPYGNGSCSYSLDKTGIEYKLLARAEVGDYIKKIEINFQFQNGVLINSMNEVFE